MSRRVLKPLIFPLSTLEHKNVIGSGVGGVSSANRAALRRRASNNSKGEPCCMKHAMYVIRFTLTSESLPEIDSLYYLSQTQAPTIYTGIAGDIYAIFSTTDGGILEIRAEGIEGSLAYGPTLNGDVPYIWYYGSSGLHGHPEGVQITDIVVTRELSTSFGPVGPATDHAVDGLEI